MVYLLFFPFFPNPGFFAFESGRVWRLADHSRCRYLKGRLDCDDENAVSSALLHVCMSVYSGNLEC